MLSRYTCMFVNALLLLEEIHYYLSRRTSQYLLNTETECWQTHVSISLYT